MSPKEHFSHKLEAAISFCKVTLVNPNFGLKGMNDHNVEHRVGVTMQSHKDTCKIGYCFLLFTTPKSHRLQPIYHHKQRYYTEKTQEHQLLADEFTNHVLKLCKKYFKSKLFTQNPTSSFPSWRSLPVHHFCCTQCFFPSCRSSTVVLLLRIFQIKMSMRC